MGGEASEPEQRLVFRAAGLAVFAELQESYLGAQQFDKFDAEAYRQMVSEERRVLLALGLRRRQRDVTPSLRTYIDTEGSMP